MMTSNNNANDPEREKLNPGNGVQTRATSNHQFNVVRRVYQQDALNKDAEYHSPNKPWLHHAKKMVRRCGFNECIANSLPIARWLPKYQPKNYLVGDLVAGATTAVMHIPQGMAYALLAEVTPVVGLYMAFFPVLIYVIFGTSPHVSMGTFSVICLMAGKVVSQHSAGIDNSSFITNNSTEVLNATNSTNTYTSIEVLSAVCMAVGAFQFAMWVLRLGAVSTLLSEPLVSGFTTAASFHVLASQIKDLIGVQIPKYNGYYKTVVTLVDISKNLTNLNWTAVIISMIACFLISLNNELLKPWISKRSRVPVPIELLAIVIGTLVARFGSLKEKFGIALVGHIPTGLPTPQVPPMELLPLIAVDAITMTMVSYTITMSMALIFAAKEKYEVDANQELLALGASNVFASFFGCAPFCASLSRSFIQYQAGSKTTITSLVSALLILFVLLWIGPFFEDLPRCVLASIILVSLKSMFMQVTELAKFWRLSKLDAVVWLVTLIITTFVSIDIGLGAGLLASVGTLFCRSQRPYTCLLGRVADTDLYVDCKRYRAAEEVPGVKIFHYCGGLNFATKNLFRSTLYRKIGFLKPEYQRPDEDNNVTKRDSYVWDATFSRRIHCVIIDATSLSYVDGPGIRSLLAVQTELAANDITVLLAGANVPVQEMVERYNSIESDEYHVDAFPTVHDAVVYYKMTMAKSKKTDLTIDVPN